MTVSASYQATLCSALLGLVFLFLVFTTPDAWSKEWPLNERPMYGGAEKTAEMKEVDQRYIEGVKAMGFTLKQGAVEAAKRGWTAMRQGDLKTAMKRFNQAWLLDKNNGAAYWGMAAVVADRDHDMEQAGSLFKRALKLLPNDADLHVDYGRFLGKRRWFEQMQGNKQKAVELLKNSTESFRKALELNAEARDAHAGLATNLMVTGDLNGAYHHAKIAIERKETDSFNMLPIIKCMMDKGITDMRDPRWRVCAAGR